MDIGNLGDPIRLYGVDFNGVVGSFAPPNEMCTVYTQLAITSCDTGFHSIVEGLEQAITNAAARCGSIVNLHHVDNILLVVHADQSGDLWLDNAAIVLNCMAKKEMRGGEIVSRYDIVDVIGLHFPAINFCASDNLVYIFRNRWRFGLFFDFTGNLNTEFTSRAIGTIYRELEYFSFYEQISNKKSFQELVSMGWFPFAEIQNEYSTLLNYHENGFNFVQAEEELLNKFGDDRMNQILRRWRSKPAFARKEPLLHAAIRAFLADEPIAVIKIVLLEIEGILRQAYRAKFGSGAKINKLLDFAVRSANEKTGLSNTLLLPEAFLNYLHSCTYKKFNATVESGSASSRHAVAHGEAVAESYTKSRALQALLTLDQIGFYL